MPKRSRSAAICDGLRKTSFVHVGRGFLPLLAVILLVAPPLAFANGPFVTVNPRSLDLNETGDGNSGTYEVVLDAQPEGDVEVTVVGARDVLEVTAFDAEMITGSTGFL